MYASDLFHWDHVRDFVLPVADALVDMSGQQPIGDGPSTSGACKYLSWAALQMPRLSQTWRESGPISRSNSKEWRVFSKKYTFRRHATPGGLLG